MIAPTAFGPVGEKLARHLRNRIGRLIILAQADDRPDDLESRFPGVSVLGWLRKRNRGGKAFKIGEQEVSYLQGQGIEPNDGPEKHIG